MMALIRDTAGRATGAVVLAAALAGCGGGDDGVEAPLERTTLPALLRVTAEAAGDACATGGVRIDSGLDTNRDGALGDSEVRQTQVVCHGTNGTAALTPLVRMRAEAAGATCPQGGVRVLAGHDLNGNGVLEDAEAASSGVLCDGTPGATGASGSTGPAGRDSLIAFAVEAPGAPCAYGGQRVLSGLDLDGNGLLDAGEVTSTVYLCSAPPADTRWVTVTGASAQAVANTGYLASSPSPVVITLPAAPTVGDWIKVTGVGSGGWTIAQNAGQRISTRGLPGGMDVTWTAQAQVGDWTGVTASADATRLAAVTAAGQLYTSADAGLSWTLRLTGQPWSGVASSADGQRLLAAVNGGALHVSTDGGLNWTNDGSARAWSAVASSADGLRLVATAYLGRIWTSADGGLSWTARESSRAWRTVASSADGRVLVAGTNGDQLYVSTDHGATWTARATGQYWWSTAASADGQRLYATVDTGAIWTSMDSGTTWQSQTPARNWRGIATSADGRYVVAATSGGPLYESVDHGNSWQPSGASANWTAVASSADGLSLVAGATGAAIQTGSRRSTTTPGITGAISGGQEDALQLQYVGGGLFMPIGYVAANLSFTVR